MVKSEAIQSLLHRAFDLAVQRGHEPEDLPAMIASALDTYQPPDQADFVYDELPEGLIDLPTAAEKYGLNRQTLRHWVLNGRLHLYGRLRGSAPGGGFLVVNESEVQAYIHAPRDRGGRPRKVPQ